MINNKNLKENNENVNNNIENIDVEAQKQLIIKKINEEFLKNVEEFSKTLNFMIADVPIQILCLDKKTENILLKNGFLRVYDLFNVELTEIEGLNDSRIGNLTASLDEFFSML